MKKKEIEEFKEGIEYAILKYKLNIIKSKANELVNENIISLKEDPIEFGGVNADCNKSNI